MTSHVISYDRYRNDLKGTWKDASGSVFDLGSHLIDQTLTLFGRPEKLTAFVSNVRMIGNPDVDDNVRYFLAADRSINLATLSSTSCYNILLYQLGRTP